MSISYSLVKIFADTFPRTFVNITSKDKQIKVGMQLFRYSYLRIKIRKEILYKNNGSENLIAPKSLGTSFKRC